MPGSATTSFFDLDTRTPRSAKQPLSDHAVGIIKEALDDNKPHV
jgi:hypothetical protein